MSKEVTILPGNKETELLFRILLYYSNGKPVRIAYAGNGGKGYFGKISLW